MRVEGKVRQALSESAGREEEMLRAERGFGYAEGREIGLGWVKIMIKNDELDSDLV